MRQGLSRMLTPPRKITPSLSIYNILLATHAGNCIPSHRGDIGQKQIASMMRLFPPPWTVEALIAIAFLTGCDYSNVYTLYRNSPTVGEIHGEKARIHVATFDAAQSEEYNRVNCETARRLFAGQGVTIRYWCEKGRYRP